MPRSPFEKIHNIFQYGYCYLCCSVGSIRYFINLCHQFADFPFQSVASEAVPWAELQATADILTAEVIADSVTSAEAKHTQGGGSIQI